MIVIRSRGGLRDPPGLSERQDARLHLAHTFTDLQRQVLRRPAVIDINLDHPGHYYLLPWLLGHGRPFSVRSRRFLWGHYAPCGTKDMLHCPICPRTKVLGPRTGRTGPNPGTGGIDGRPCHTDNRGRSFPARLLDVVKLQALEALKLAARQERHPHARPPYAEAAELGHFCGHVQWTPHPHCVKAVSALSHRTHCDFRRLTAAKLSGA